MIAPGTSEQLQIWSNAFENMLEEVTQKLVESGQDLPPIDPDDPGFPLYQAAYATGAINALQGAGMIMLGGTADDAATEIQFQFIQAAEESK